MRRHGNLQNLAKGLLPIVVLALTLAACNDCSPKNTPPVLPAPIPTTPDARPHDDIPRGKPPVRPMDDRPSDGDLGRKPDVVPDDIPDVTPDGDEIVVTQSHSGGKTSRPSAGQDYDPFGEGDDEPETKPALNADDYKVVLDVTDQITLGSNATLRVWIGLENYIPKPIPSTTRDDTTIPASLGDYARITPYAPDFEVGPEESQVMRIVDSGSAVLFSLKPTKEGEFLISARIELYDNPDLMGVAVPKTSDIVSVVVTVDKKAAVKSHLGQLGDIAWDEFLKFWGALVVLLLGALYFIIRKFVKKKTGYGGDSSHAYGGGGSFSTDEPAQPSEPSSSGETVDDPFAAGESGESAEDPFASGESGESGEDPFA